MVNTSVQNNSGPVKTGSVKKASATKRKAGPRKNGVAAKGRRKAAEGVTASLYRQGRNAVDGVYNAASGIGSALPKIPRQLHLRERGQAVYGSIEGNPLIYGAVGLGVGILIAALLPSMHSRNSHR